MELFFVKLHLVLNYYEQYYTTYTSYTNGTNVCVGETGVSGGNPPA